MDNQSISVRVKSLQAIDLFTCPLLVSRARYAEMSIRLEMLQVARLAPKVLGESADLVNEFLLSRRNPDGGFVDRTGKSDLYYTIFGLEGLAALHAEIPSEKVIRFLDSFGDGEGLDFVHLCCLAGCWATAGGLGEPKIRASLLRRIAEYRTGDGGFNADKSSPFGTAYGAFLAMGAYQDLGEKMSDPLRLVQSLKFLETPDGGWSNERSMKTGGTNSTAAAVTVLRQLQVPISQSVGDWLLAQAHPQGGFKAMPQAPIPDLLSTATALHALAGLEVSFEPLKESCLDFIDSLWTNDGAFHGNWTDDFLDCEYTFYGLLALGHLSL